jgi:hypothetical protein
LAGGNFDEDNIPESIRRLLSPDAIRAYYQSTCGYSCQQSNRDNSSETSVILADECSNHFALAPNAQVAVNGISLCHFWARKLYGQSGVQQSQYAGRDLFPHQ